MSLVPVVASESESIGRDRAIVGAASSRRESFPLAERNQSGDISPNWFVRMLDSIWSRKLAAKNLHFHTGAPERTCRDWSRGATDPDATVLARLLRSADGGRILDFIMAGSSAPWWRDLREDRIMAGAWRDSRRQVEEQLRLALD